MITDHSFEQNDIIDGNPSNINNNQLLPSGNFNNSRRNEFSDEKYNKIFHSIKQACDENKVSGILHTVHYYFCKYLSSLLVLVESIISHRFH